MNKYKIIFICFENRNAKTEITTLKFFKTKAKSELNDDFGISNFQIYSLGVHRRVDYCSSFLPNKLCRLSEEWEERDPSIPSIVVMALDNDDIQRFKLFEEMEKEIVQEIKYLLPDVALIMHLYYGSNSAFETFYSLFLTEENFNSCFNPTLNKIDVDKVFKLLKLDVFKDIKAGNFDTRLWNKIFREQGDPYENFRHNIKSPTFDKLLSNWEHKNSCCAQPISLKDMFGFDLSKE